jgi:hypothetical protein
LELLNKKKREERYCYNWSSLNVRVLKIYVFNRVKKAELIYQRKSIEKILSEQQIQKIGLDGRL